MRFLINEYKREYLLDADETMSLLFSNAEYFKKDITLLLVTATVKYCEGLLYDR